MNSKLQRATAIHAVLMDKAIPDLPLLFLLAELSEDTLLVIENVVQRYQQMQRHMQFALQPAPAFAAVPVLNEPMASEFRHTTGVL